VQGPKELLSHQDRFPDLQALMELFLDNVETVFDQ
jgi:hypothetical protein